MMSEILKTHEWFKTGDECFHNAERFKPNPDGSGTVHLRMDWCKSIQPTPIDVAAKYALFTMQELVKRYSKVTCEGCIKDIPAQKHHLNGGCHSVWGEKIERHASNLTQESQLYDWYRHLTLQKEYLGTLDLQWLANVLKCFTISLRMYGYFQKHFYKTLGHEHVVGSIWEAKFRENEVQKK